MNLEQIHVGDVVLVVEHHEPTRTRLPDGETRTATITGISGLYISVRYDDPRSSGRQDVFWRESGWRAWDGRMRWRLEPASSPGRR